MKFMKYRLDASTEFKHSGNILNCADNSTINPLNFVITSQMRNIKTGEVHTVGVQKDGVYVQFSLPPNSLQLGTYEWRIYLKNQMVSWVTARTVVEVI